MAVRSTSAAAAPSCKGTVASGTKRGSALAAAASWELISCGPGGAFGGGQFVAEHIDPAADHLRSMPFLVIQATRPAMSESGLDTGRVGFAPAKEKASDPWSSMARTDGKRAASLRIASSSAGGTRWAWLSMIKQNLLGRDGTSPSAMASPMAEMRMGSDFEADVRDGARHR